MSSWALHALSNMNNTNHKLGFWENLVVFLKLVTKMPEEYVFSWLTMEFGRSFAKNPIDAAPIKF